MAHPLAAPVRDGDPRGVARALTLVEAGGEEGAALLASLSGDVGRAHRIGVTGPPGVGKSTLVAALATAWRAVGRRVGIVAVDPTSPFTGGALLGDRVRMGALAGDAGVFIRSLATRGAGGGVSLATHDAADVLDAAGFDPVVVETVGVGQGEVAVAGVADTVVVVLAPGHGDGIQAMKGGVIEAADLLVVNQADREGADALAAELVAALELREVGPRPEVLLTCATKGGGVGGNGGNGGNGGVCALRDAIDRHRARLAAATSGPTLRARREARALARIRDAVDRARADAFWPQHAPALAALVADVVEGRTTVAAAAQTLLPQPSGPGRGGAR